MKRLEFMYNSRIVKLDLSKPNIIYTPYKDIQEEIRDQISKTLNAKAEGSYNFAEITDRQFQVLTIDENDTFNNEMKLTSKSSINKLILQKLASIDDNQREDISTEISNSIKHLLELTNISDKLEFDDNHIIKEEDIVKRFFAEYYTVSSKCDCSDEVLFDVARQLKNNTKENLMLIIGYPRDIQAGKAIKLLEDLQTSEIMSIVITNCLNFVVCGALSMNMSIRYIKDTDTIVSINELLENECLIGKKQEIIIRLFDLLNAIDL